MGSLHCNGMRKDAARAGAGHFASSRPSWAPGGPATSPRGPLRHRAIPFRHSPQLSQLIASPSPKVDLF
eukprot:9816894-Alexandrium_andersonii.AAC.1